MSYGFALIGGGIGDGRIIRSAAHRAHCVFFPEHDFLDRAASSARVTHSAPLELNTVGMVEVRRVATVDVSAR